MGKPIWPCIIISDPILIKLTAQVFERLGYSFITFLSQRLSNDNTSVAALSSELVHLARFLKNGYTNFILQAFIGVIYEFAVCFPLTHLGYVLIEGNMNIASANDEVMQS